MSSWERSRSIPWSKIPSQDAAADVGYSKEKIFRQLQREADQYENNNDSNTVIMQQGGGGGTGSLDSSSSMQQQQGGQIQTQIKQGIAFRWGELFKNAAFGGCIGTITGSVFGFLDGMRTAGQSEVLKNASNMAKGRYLMQGMTRSATTFGVFFSGFHVVKYGCRVTLDPGQFGEIGISSVISLGALLSKPSFRPAMPYATMLIIMDGAHIIMREFD